MALIVYLFAIFFNFFAVLELTKNVCTLFFKKVDGIKNVDLVWMAVSSFTILRSCKKVQDEPSKIFENGKQLLWYHWIPVTCKLFFNRNHLIRLYWLLIFGRHFHRWMFIISSIRSSKPIYGKLFYLGPLFLVLSPWLFIVVFVINILLISVGLCIINK